MDSGAGHQATAYRPFKGLNNQIPEQTSYQSPITVSEGSDLPRIHQPPATLEKGIEQLIENPPPNHLSKAYSLAQATSKERRDIPQPTRPSAGACEAVFFLSRRVGKVGERVVIQDQTGMRIENEGSP